jgi:aromatic O-demethylase, reductase subunit
VNLTLPIRDVVPATPRARILRIDLQGNAFPYVPGQSVRVSAPGAEKKRTYSIAASPEDSASEHCVELLVGVDAEGRAGEIPLEAGAPIDVDGPSGSFTFPLEPRAERFVFVAGGTGIAPLRSMMRHALHGPHRQIGLYYSARTPFEFAYEEEFLQLARDGRIELTQTVTRDAPTEQWAGKRGRIGREHLAPLVHNPDTLCFVCGPRAMVDEMPRLLEEMGIPRENIRVEEWG